MIVVPALTPISDGHVNAAALRSYIDRAAKLWVGGFLLSGSTTRGDLLSSDERASLIDIWQESFTNDRLLACCWNSVDIEEAYARGVRPMVVLRGLVDTSAALTFLSSLPAVAFIYSHPMYTPTVFDSKLATLAAEEGVLPAGGKIAKIGLSSIAAIRTATGADFVLLDGSSRHIGESMSAGATGVIATPLSHIPNPFPSSDLFALQTAVDASQSVLDSLPDRPQRTAALLEMAFA